MEINADGLISVEVEDIDLLPALGATVGHVTDVDDRPPFIYLGLLFGNPERPGVLRFKIEDDVAEYIHRELTSVLDGIPKETT